MHFCLLTTNNVHVIKRLYFSLSKFYFHAALAEVTLRKDNISKI